MTGYASGGVGGTVLHQHAAGDGPARAEPAINGNLCLAWRGAEPPQALTGVGVKTIHPSVGGASVQAHAIQSGRVLDVAPGVGGPVGLAGGRVDCANNAV